MMETCRGYHRCPSLFFQRTKSKQISSPIHSYAYLFQPPIGNPHRHALPSEHHYSRLFSITSHAHLLPIGYCPPHKKIICFWWWPGGRVRKMKMRCNVASFLRRNGIKYGGRELGWERPKYSWRYMNIE